MTDFVNTIDLYGDEIAAEKIIGRTIEEYNDDIIASIGSYAFYRCKALTSVNLPNVTSIEQYTFNGCKALTSIDLPMSIQAIDSGAFAGTAITSFKMPNSVQTIGTTLI